MTKQEYEKLASFRYSLRKFLNFSRLAAAEQRLAPQQYLALLEIKGFPGREEVTVGELAERLQVTPHSVVGLVNRLEKRGLVARKPSEHDRRCVFVALTEKGQSTLEKLYTAHRHELVTAGPLLIDLLNKINATPPPAKA